MTKIGRHDACSQDRLGLQQGKDAVDPPSKKNYRYAKSIQPARSPLYRARPRTHEQTRTATRTQGAPSRPEQCARCGGIGVTKESRHVVPVLPATSLRRHE